MGHPFTVEIELTTTSGEKISEGKSVQVLLLFLFHLLHDFSHALGNLTLDQRRKSSGSAQNLPPLVLWDVVALKKTCSTTDANSCHSDDYDDICALCTYHARGHGWPTSNPT